MDLTISLLFIPIVILAFVLFKPTSKNLPPSPPAWPILGHLPTIFTQTTPLHITLTNMSRTYGPLFLLRLGRKYTVVVSTSEGAMEILKTNDRAFSGRYVPMSFRIDHHLKHSLVWSDCNDTWRNLRKIIRNEIFSQKMLQGQEKIREKVVDDMVNFIKGKVGNVVHVRHWVFGCLLNILGNAVFSKNVFEYSDEGDKVGMQKLICDMLLRGATPDVGEFFPILEALDLQKLRRRCADQLARGAKMWEGIVKERKEHRNKECKDMLDVVLTNDFTYDQINAIFLETFGPGAETSSATVEWALTELIRNPEKMAKLHDELDQVVGKSSIPKESNLPQFPYLQACIKETMRLHPPAPFLLPHRSIETCTVMGYMIPKDCEVLINAYAIGRDPKFWAEPSIFRPERFIESDVDYNGKHFQFIPFGSGRRMCVAMPLATRTIPLILSSLVHAFYWKLPDGKPYDTLEMNDMLRISLSKDPALLAIPNVKA